MTRIADQFSKCPGYRNPGQRVPKQLNTHVVIGIHKFASWYFTDATAWSLHPPQQCGGVLCGRVPGWG